MTKLAPEWVRTSDPVIRSPARYRWTTAPAVNLLEKTTYKLSPSNNPVYLDHIETEVELIVMVILNILTVTFRVCQEKHSTN